MTEMNQKTGIAAFILLTLSVFLETGSIAHAQLPGITAPGVTITPPPPTTPIVITPPIQVPEIIKNEEKENQKAQDSKAEEKKEEESNPNNISENKKVVEEIKVASTGIYHEIETMLQLQAQKKEEMNEQDKKNKAVIFPNKEATLSQVTKEEGGSVQTDHKTVKQSTTPVRSTEKYNYLAEFFDTYMPSDQYPTIGLTPRVTRAMTGIGGLSGLSGIILFTGRPRKIAARFSSLFSLS